MSMPCEYYPFEVDFSPIVLPFELVKAESDFSGFELDTFFMADTVLYES